MKRRTIVAALAALFLSTPGLAQMAPPSALAPPTDESPELAQKKREAAIRLLALMRPVWTDEQIGRIMYIGWYSGAAALCDDLEIDPAKLEKAIKSLEPADMATMSPDKAQFLERNLMMHVGIATGWVMSGHLRDVPKFCAEARQSKADMPADRHLFEMMGNTPATPPK
jgi:hypothetical protein